MPNNVVIKIPSSNKEVFSEGDIFLNKDKGDAYILSYVSNDEDHEGYSLINLKSGNRWTHTVTKDGVNKIIKRDGFIYCGNVEITIKTIE